MDQLVILNKYVQTTMSKSLSFELIDMVVEKLINDNENNNNMMYPSLSERYSHSNVLIFCLKSLSSK